MTGKEDNHMPKIKEGLYLFHRQDYPVTEATAMALIRELSDDLNSDNPHIQWGYNPGRSSLQTFVGIGLNDGQNCVRMEKSFTPHDEMQVHLEYCEGTKVLYSITDLCYVPESSSLLQLYTKVAPVVYATAMENRTPKVHRIIHFV